MANINTSGAASGRDFSYGASRMSEPHFMDLYDDVMGKLIELQKVECPTTVQMEINKLRNKIKKLITKYMEKSLSELATMGQYKSAALENMDKLEKLRKLLVI